MHWAGGRSYAAAHPATAHSTATDASAAHHTTVDPAAVAAEGGARSGGGEVAVVAAVIAVGTDVAMTVGAFGAETVDVRGAGPPLSVVPVATAGMPVATVAARERTS